MNRPTTTSKELLSETLVMDMHGCMPVRPGDTAFLPQIDRYRAAGVDAVFLNAGFGEHGVAEHIHMLATFREWIGGRSDLVLIRDANSIQQAHAAEKLAVGFNIEGMNALGEDPDMVRLYRDLGVCWMLIAYNRNNPAGGGCQDDDNGLTAFGRTVIERMAQVGMILCCTHSGRRTALEAIEYSPNPVIFSHSNPRALHEHPRNIDDEMIRACAARGGVICLSGIGVFLGENVARPSKLAEHIDYVVQLVGLQHAGIGLDYVFDSQELDDYIAAMPDTFPPHLYREGIRMVAPEQLGDTVAALQDKGYRDDDLHAIPGRKHHAHRQAGLEGAGNGVRMQRHNILVVGLGIYGSALCWQLAKAGHRVIGVDRFHPPHDRGSSHGESRITRQAIGEDPALSRFAIRSHEIWREMEALTGRHLLEICGCAIIGNRSGTGEHAGKADFVKQTIVAAERYDIDHEVMDGAELRRRFSPFQTQGDELVYFEPGGGMVFPEETIAAQLELAQRAGAELRFGATVTLTPGGGSEVSARIGDERLDVDRIVIAAGPWTADILTSLGCNNLADQLSLFRQTLHWFRPDDAKAYAPDRFPAFIWMHGNEPEAYFYGFPAIGPSQGGAPSKGVKVAAEQFSNPTHSPANRPRYVSTAETHNVHARHVSGRLAGLPATNENDSSCLYTVTADARFRVGPVSEYPGFICISACSGHGFKHAPAIAEALARAIATDDWQPLLAFLP